MGGVVSTLSYALLFDPISAVLLYSFAGLLTAMLAFVATLSLAADSSLEGAEGFAFAAMMSILNLTQPLAATFDAVLYEHVVDRHLPALIIVSVAATGLVFFLVPLIRLVPVHSRAAWTPHAALCAYETGEATLSNCRNRAAPGGPFSASRQLASATLW